MLPHSIGVEVHAEAGELRIFGEILAAVEPSGPVRVGVIDEQQRRMAVFGDGGLATVAAGWAEVGRLEVAIPGPVVVMTLRQAVFAAVEKAHHLQREAVATVLRIHSVDVV